MKCELCHREAKMFWKDKEHKNGRSETFYTNFDNQTVCIDCLGYVPKSLTELNEERKLKSHARFIL